MPTSSTIFSHFETDPQVDWQRHEVASAAFGRLRAGMRYLIQALDAEESDPMPAAMLRQQLFGWLTTPAAFRSTGSTMLGRLGSTEHIRERWGHDFLSVCLRVDRALSEMGRAESPLRDALEHVLTATSAVDRTFAVYCRRSAKRDFQQMATIERLELEERLVFLHSASAYRDLEPFDTLIHVGPFRSSSYSSVPPCVLNSPRFTRLLQFTWEGLADEEGCANDPVVQALTGAECTSTPPLASHLGTSHSSSLKKSEVKYSAPESPDDDPAEVIIDEIASLQPVRIQRVDTARAVVLGIGDDLGVAYASHSTVTLLVGEGQSMTIETVMAAHVPTRRAFLVWNDIGDIDIGGSRAHDGRLSTQWKGRLREEVTRDSGGLERRLRAAGLELDTLHGCLRNWMEPATTVIHAPQQRRHFEVLISVIGVEPAGHRPHPDWWRVAWREIAESRGEAIQVGMQEQDIIAEECQRILEKRRSQLMASAESGTTFRFQIPHDESLEGAFTLYRIESVEHGFRASLDRLKQIVSLTEAEAWRV